MVFDVGLDFCYTMTIRGVRRVTPTAHARYRRIPLTCCMNFFPSSLINFVVLGSFVYCTLAS